jgi:hypothetical protein
MFGNLQRNLRGLIVVFAAASASCLTLPSPREISHEELTTLRRLCNEMPTPPSFTKIRERTLEKRGVFIYSAEYSSREDPQSVRMFYETQSYFQEWERRARASAGTVYLDFLKGPYKIVLEFQTFSFTDERVFLLSCSWHQP